jgi:hypothetical protein
MTRAVDSVGGSWSPSRVRRFAIVCSLVFSAIAVAAPAAQAACATDPTTISFHRMIVIGKTGESNYPVMLIGRVVAIKDLGGGRGGDSTARIAVAAHPTTNWAPLVARVPFWKPPPRLWVSENLEFHKGERFVVIADRNRDGTYASDGACGHTRDVRVGQFNRLVDLAERQ